jgi:hypothetical protein
MLTKHLLLTPIVCSVLLAAAPAGAASRLAIGAWADSPAELTAPQTAPLILIDHDDDDDDDERGEHRSRGLFGLFFGGDDDDCDDDHGRHRGDDDDDHRRGDDDDDDDCRGSMQRAAPAGTVAPPDNGLFDTGGATATGIVN